MRSVYCSAVCGKGNLSTTTALFGTCRSTHGLIFPDFFLRATMGGAHSEASIRWIISSNRSLDNSCATSSLTENGSLLNIDTMGLTSSCMVTLCTKFLAKPRVLSRGAKSPLPAQVEVPVARTYCYSTAARRHQSRSATSLWHPFRECPHWSSNAVDTSKHP